MNRRRTRALLKARRHPEAPSQSPTASGGILAYRRLAVRPTGVAPPTRTVRPKAFAQHVTGLRAAGVSVVPLEDVTAASGARVSITFEGAYACALHEGMPLVEALGIPVTIFVSGCEIGTGALSDDDWPSRDVVPASMVRPLTAPELERLARHPLVSLGVYVPARPREGSRPSSFPGSIPDALAASVAGLRRFTDVAGLPVAFAPEWAAWGRPGGLLARAAEAAGCTQAVTQVDAPVGPEADPLALPRLGVYDWDTSATLLAKLRGEHGCRGRANRRAS